MATTALRQCRRDARLTLLANRDSKAIAVKNTGLVPRRALPSVHRTLLHHFPTTVSETHIRPGLVGPKLLLHVVIHEFMVNGSHLGRQNHIISYLDTMHYAL